MELVVNWRLGFEVTPKVESFGEKSDEAPLFF